MKVEELYKVPKWAGIYYFKNTINNKYYIEQSVMLRKRVLHHISNFNNDRYDAPLYKAFKKYGFEHFEFGILEELKSGYTKEALKAKLDELEIFYIEKFDSYNKGYNLTRGGDKGVLGLNHTEDSKAHISNTLYLKCILTEHPINKWVKAKNLETKHEIIAINEGELSRCICGDSNKLRPSIHRCLMKLQYTCNNYIIAYYLEEYPVIHDNDGKYVSKITEEAIEDIKLGMKEKEFLSKYNVCKKTYYNWKNSLKI